MVVMLVTLWVYMGKHSIDTIDRVNETIMRQN